MVARSGTPGADVLREALLLVDEITSRSTKGEDWHSLTRTVVGLPRAGRCGDGSTKSARCVDSLGVTTTS